MKDLIATAKKLIEKAEKATPGKRKVVRPEPGDFGPCIVVLDREGDRYKNEICVHYTNPDGSTGNPEFHAACSPEVITALCRLLLEQHELLNEWYNLSCDLSITDAKYHIVTGTAAALTAAGKNGEAG